MKFEFSRFYAAGELTAGSRFAVAATRAIRTIGRLKENPKIPDELFRLRIDHCTGQVDRSVLPRLFSKCHRLFSSIRSEGRLRDRIEAFSRYCVVLAIDRSRLPGESPVLIGA